MASSESDKDEPNLELPSLSLGLRRKNSRKDRKRERSAAPSEPVEAAEGSPPPADQPPTAVAVATPPVAPVDDASAEAPVEAPKPRRRPRLPAVSRLVAAILTGVVTGLVGVGLSAAALRGCELIRGTESCGGAGVVVLVAIFLAMVLIGQALLAAWGVSDPGGTSFLAVGLVAVITLLFFMNVLFSSVMLVIVPVLGALCFATSTFVTTRYIELYEEPPEHL